MEDNDFLKEIREAFLLEALELVEQNESNFLELENNANDTSIIDKIFRLAHNIKGSSKSVGFDELSSFGHQMENLLSEIKNGRMKVCSNVVDILLQCNDCLKQNIISLKDTGKMAGGHEVLVDLIKATIEGQGKQVETKTKIEVGVQAEVESESESEKTPETLLAFETKKEEEPAPKIIEAEQATSNKSEEFVKISLTKIDNLLNYFGEQVILQSTLEYAKRDLLKNRDIVVKTIGQLSKITYDLQQNAISLRMFSLKNLFMKMERTIRDTAKQLDKKIIFTKIGENSEMDKTILDSIADPLTHMIRNAADHGIESTRDRIKKGKPEEGHITLEAYHKSGFFYLVISDDGGGLNKEKILAKAIQSKLIKESQKDHMREQEIYQLIFASGLSTKEQTTSISGRGVGMDVVKDAITKLKGTCEIKSQEDKGTTFTIRLPLTLAIFNGIIVRLGEQKYIFPNSDIEETIMVDSTRLRSLGGRLMLNHKNSVVPFIDLSKIFRGKNSTPTQEKIIPSLVVKSGEARFALGVSELLSQQRVVQKKLGHEIKRIPGVAGGTILGDGKVALILEAQKFIDIYLGEKKAA